MTDNYIYNNNDDDYDYYDDDTGINCPKHTMNDEHEVYGA